MKHKVSLFRWEEGAYHHICDGEALVLPEVDKRFWVSRAKGGYHITGKIQIVDPQTERGIYFSSETSTYKIEIQ